MELSGSSSYCIVTLFLYLYASKRQSSRIIPSGFQIAVVVGALIHTNYGATYWEIHCYITFRHVGLYTTSGVSNHSVTQSHFRKQNDCRKTEIKINRNLLKNRIFNGELFWLYESDKMPEWCISLKRLYTSSLSGIRLFQDMERLRVYNQIKS